MSAPIASIKTDCLSQPRNLQKLALRKHRSYIVSQQDPFFIWIGNNKKKKMTQKVILTLTSPTLSSKDAGKFSRQNETLKPKRRA